MTPEVHYARLGDAHIAYQVFGSGDLDLVYVGEFWHSIEAQWDEPRFAAFLRRLGTFSRVICLDQRGSGLSDPLPLGEQPSLDLFTDDVRAVMDAVGMARAALLGVAGGSMISCLLAATVPERVQALVLLNGFARLTAAPDYPWGTTPAFEARVMADLSNGWGRGVLADVLAPSEADDPVFRSWLARYQRFGASPGEVLAQRRMMQNVDIRQVLPSIRTPTLVVHRRDNRLINVGHGRYLAERIPGAEYVEVPGGDYLPFLGDVEAILAPIERFLTGTVATTDQRHRSRGAGTAPQPRARSGRRRLRGALRRTGPRRALCARRPGSCSTAWPLPARRDPHGRGRAARGRDRGDRRAHRGPGGGPGRPGRSAGDIDRPRPRRRVRNRLHRSRRPYAAGSPRALEAVCRERPVALRPLRTMSRTMRELGNKPAHSHSLDSAWPHGYRDRHDASADLG